MKANKSIAIIGAGIAGLAAAIRLQAKGEHVTVYEQSPLAGGKLAECNINGYRFDMGPSLFTMPHFIDELFALANKSSKDYFTYQKEDTVCRYHFEDGSVFTAYADRDKYVAEACRVFDVDEHILRKYLQANAFKYNRTKKIFLEQSLHRLSSYLKIETLKGIAAMPKLDMTSSLHNLHVKTFRDRRLVQLFDRYATYNGSTPFRAPGIMSLISHLEMDLGTFYPKGGMISIPKALFSLAKDLGVQFEFNAKVEQILTDGNQIQGIRIGQKVVPTDVVVCNADVYTAYTHLMPQLKAPERVLNQERSSSGIIFYWCMNRTFPDLQLHNIFFAKDYKREFEWIAEGGEWHKDPTVYINITSKKESSDAPAGGENWFVMINVPADTRNDWPRTVELVRAAVIAKLERILQCNLNSYIIGEQVLTPAMIEQRTSSHLGALYGSASNDRFAAFLRHPNFSSKVKGLYFCGGSVHPGGGIPLCLLSAKIVADLFAANR
jgi:phytoene desaturase